MLLQSCPILIRYSCHICTRIDCSSRTTGPMQSSSAKRSEHTLHSWVKKYPILEFSQRSGCSKFNRFFRLPTRLSTPTILLSRISMPMHTECDIVMANLSVCRHTLVLYQTGCHIVKRFPPSGSVIFVNENENENYQKRKNNEFVNEN